MIRKVSDRKNAFPAHWEVLPFLEAVCDSSRGNPKIKVGDYQESGSIPIVDQGQRLFGGYTDDQALICNCELPAIIFGDHTRVFKFIEEPFALGADGTKLLEPLANLDKKFLFHFLRQLEIKSAGYSRHFKFLKEVWIPVPPIQEQKRIATILDKADALRRKRQQAIELADQFLRSVFLEMFGDPVSNPKGWEKKSISEVSEVITGNTPSRSASENFGNDIEWIKSDNINTPSHFLTHAAEGLSHVGIKKARVVDRGAILVTCIAGSPDCIGNVGIVDRTVSFNQQINALVPSGTVTTEYLYSVILFGKRLVQNASTNSMKGMVSKGNLAKVCVPIPPLSAQEKYSELFRDFVGKSQKIRESYDQIKELNASLSYQAFNNQL